MNNAAVAPTTTNTQEVTMSANTTTNQEVTMGYIPTTDAEWADAEAAWDAEIDESIEDPTQWDDAPAVEPAPAPVPAAPRAYLVRATNLDTHRNLRVKVTAADRDGARAAALATWRGKRVLIDSITSA